MWGYIHRTDVVRRPSARPIPEDEIPLPSWEGLKERVGLPAAMNLSLRAIRRVSGGEGAAICSTINPLCPPILRETEKNAATVLRVKNMVQEFGYQHSAMEYDV